MEMILGLIEDVLDKFEHGSPEEKEDSKSTLMQDINQFIKNLQPLVASGNEEAQKLLTRLNDLNF